MKKLEVSAGILMNNDQILCLQRGKGKYNYVSYKYEFPGGKLEQGESPAAALRRELVEEMHLNIKEADLGYFMTVEHQYPDFYLTMHSFTCNLDSRDFDLLEHIDYRWLNAEELGDLDWAGADWPIVQRLMEEKGI
ncbi:MAG: (deoxy)nucleoside triphosphate pyrophosphohydrolase [Firmicutes bacterium]|nr:(deoxy)nucleoside triphosphate pyrophosphohydrolase [Bacillota bacterium]